MPRKKLDAKNDSVRMNLFMPTPQYEQVQKVAKLTHKSMAQFVREACQHYTRSEALRLKRERDAST